MQNAHAMRELLFISVVGILVPRERINQIVSRSLFYINKTNVPKTTSKNTNIYRPYKMDYKTIQID